MTAFAYEEEFVPSVEQLEDACKGVGREARLLLAAARTELRRIQDFDAELEDATPDTMLAARAARHVSRHRLRAISRQFTVAHAQLVPITDRNRFVAAQRVISWCEDAQRADPPYLEPA